jgi:drug/metabolite transporter (DMT)-like permease
MFIISGIAIISTIAPLTLFLAGLQKLSSSKASIVVMIEPVVATVAAFFFLGEQLTPLQIGGALLVLVALVINARK